MRIASPVGLLMVDAMCRHPEDWPALECQRGAHRQEVLHDPGRLVAPVRQQAVVGHADAEHTGHEVEHDGGHNGANVDEEERCHREDMERRHDRCREPVDATLVFAPVHVQCRCHRAGASPVMPVWFFRTWSSRTIPKQGQRHCNTSVRSHGPARKFMELHGFWRWRHSAMLGT